MTRSKTSTYSPKVVRQTVAAEARNAGVEARAARHKAHAHVASLKANKADSAGLARRNPGRMDGVQWNGASFTCPTQVDDGCSDDESHDLESESDYKAESAAVSDSRPRVDFTISLMDVAKQSRPRGIAKQFEIVEGLPKVIILDENDFGLTEKDEDDSEWEDLARTEALEEPLEVPEKAFKDARKSYSAVVTNV